MNECEPLSQPMTAAEQSAWLGLTAEVRRLTAENAALCEWKEAIVDAAVVGWTYNAETESNPRKAVEALLCWESKIALDPQVSAEAKALHDEIAALRTKHTEFHARAQRAEAAMNDLLKCNAKLANGEAWVQGSLGRAFLAYVNKQLRDENAALRDDIKEEEANTRAGAAALRVYENEIAALRAEVAKVTATRDQYWRLLECFQVAMKDGELIDKADLEAVT